MQTASWWNGTTFFKDCLGQTTQHSQGTDQQSPDPFPSKSWWDLSRYNCNGWQMLAIHFSLHCTALGIDYTHAEFIGFRFQTWHTHSFSGTYLSSLSITGENGGHYSNITNMFETWSYIHVPMIFDNKGSCLKRRSLQDATATSHLIAPSEIWMTE